MAKDITLDPKQPAEKLDYVIDFAKVLPSGVTLSTIVSYDAFEVDDTAVTGYVGTSPAPAISGTKVTIWMIGGADEKDYKVRLIVDDSDSRRHVVNLLQQVRN